ncbi:hypothetical protein EMIT0P100_120135 [Pseudomonas sp. IT-P100]
MVNCEFAQSLYINLPSLDSISTSTFFKSLYDIAYSVLNILNVSDLRSNRCQTILMRTSQQVICQLRSGVRSPPTAANLPASIVRYQVPGSYKSCR